MIKVKATCKKLPLLSKLVLEYGSQIRVIEEDMAFFSVEIVSYNAVIKNRKLNLENDNKRTASLFKEMIANDFYVNEISFEVYQELENMLPEIRNANDALDYCILNAGESVPEEEINAQEIRYQIGKKIENEILRFRKEFN